MYSVWLRVLGGKENSLAHSVALKYWKVGFVLPAKSAKTSLPDDEQTFVLTFCKSLLLQLWMVKSDLEHMPSEHSWTQAAIDSQGSRISTKNVKLEFLQMTWQYVILLCVLIRYTQWVPFLKYVWHKGHNYTFGNCFQLQVETAREIIPSASLIAFYGHGIPVTLFLVVSWHADFWASQILFMVVISHSEQLPC